MKTEFLNYLSQHWRQPEDLARVAYQWAKLKPRQFERRMSYAVRNLHTAALNRRQIMAGGVR